MATEPVSTAMTPEEEQAILNFTPQEIPTNKNDILNEFSSHIVGATATPTPEISPTSPAEIPVKTVYDTRQQYQMTEPVYNPLDQYEFFKDGTILPRYTSYIKGTDNEERLAQRQTNSERNKLGRKKFVTNVGLQFAKGTYGLGSGIAQALKTNTFSDIYNNEVESYLSELIEQNEMRNPHYLTQAYKDKNFWEKLTTDTNTFWNTEVRQGLEYMGGAILSEVPWALITGGSSLALSAPKLALKLTGKTVAKFLGRKGVKEAAEWAIENSAKTYAKRVGGIFSILSKTPQAVDEVAGAYSAAIGWGKTIKALNTMRFAATSGGFEATDEAWNNYNESIDSFILKMHQREGRMPTSDELAEFSRIALKGSNKVWGANAVLLGMSNMYTIGGILGYKNPFNNMMRKLPFGKVGSAFVDEAGKVSHLAKTPSFARKAAGSIWSVIETPVVEGSQEGIQSIFSKTAQAYTTAKYNSESINDFNLGLQSFWDATKQTLGSKEGWNEIGIGALIGGIGGIGGKLRQGGIKGLFKNEYLAGLKEQTQGIQQATITANAFKTGLVSPSQQRVVDKFNNTISRSALNTMAEKSDRAGDMGAASTFNEMSQFKYHKQMRDLGLEKYVEENAHTMIDGLADSDITNLGIAEDKVQDYRDYLKKESSKQFRRNSWALEVAEELTPQLNKAEKKALNQIGFDRADMVELAALELSLGVNSKSNAKEALKEGLKSLGWNESDGKLDILFELTESKNQKSVKVVDEYNSLVAEEKTLIQRRDELYSATQMAKAAGKEVTKEGVETEAEANMKELQTVSLRLQQIANERLQLEAEYNSVSAKNPIVASGNAVINPEVLDSLPNSLSAVAEAKTLFDDAIRKLEEIAASSTSSTEAKKYANAKLDEVKAAMSEFNTQTKAYDTYLNNFTLRTSQQYGYSSFKSLIPRYFNKLAAPIEDEGLEFFGESFKGDKTYVSLEDYIAENKDKLSEKDIASMRIIHRIMLSQSKLAESIGATYEADPISDIDFASYTATGETDYQRFVQGIVYRMMKNIPLSPNQSKIYDSYKLDIDRSLAIARGQVGNTIDDVIGVMPTGMSKVKSFKEALAELITKIIQANKLIEGRVPVELNKDIIPTDEDYNEFADLSRQYDALIAKKADNTISDEEIALVERFNTLKDKIDKWGLTVGADSPQDMKLSNLIQVYIALDQAGVEDESETAEVNTPNTVKDIEWFSIGNKRRLDIGQVYDTAVVSKKALNNGKIQYTLHNISIDRLLEIVGDVADIQAVTIVKKAEVLKPLTAYSSEKKTIQQSANKRIRVTLEDGTVFDLNYDLHGNVTVSLPLDSSKKLGNLVFMPVSKLQQAYQPLLQETEGGELIMVKSDFTFESGTRTTDSNAARRAKEGDVLRLVVAKNDGFNQKLLQQFRRAKTPEKIAKIAKELEDKLLVYLVNSTGDIVQVLKSNPLQKSEEGTTGSVPLRNLRKQILTALLADEANPLSPATFDTGLSVVVEGVLPAFPNIEVTRNETGEYVVKQHNFDNRMIGNVLDIGFMVDGQYFTKNGVKIDTIGKPYMQSYITDKKYKGQRVPFVVFKYQGKPVVYPVTAKETIADYTSQLDEILSAFPAGTDEKNIQRANALNKFILEFGLSIDQLGFTDSDVNNDDKILKLIDAASSVIVRPKIQNWVTQEETITDILNRDATIDIDISDNPLMAPKLLLNLSSPLNAPASEAPNIPIAGGLLGEAAAAKKRAEDNKDTAEAHLSSRVYKEALEYFNGDEARAKVVFHTMHSKGFLSWALDNGLMPVGEGTTIDDFLSIFTEGQIIGYADKKFTLRDIMRYWEVSSIDENGMSSDQKTMLIHLWAKSSTNSLTEFISSLRDAFFDNGLFKLNISKINALGIFSENDVLDMQSDSAIQGDLMGLLWQVSYDASNQSAEYNTLLHPTMLLEDSYSIIDALLTAGKYDTVHGAAQDVEQVLANSLGGVPAEKMLDAVMNLGSEFQSLKDRVYSDELFLTYLSKKYSNMHPLAVKEIAATGTIEDATSALSPKNVTGVLSAKGRALRGKIYAIINEINLNNQKADGDVGFNNIEIVKTAIQLIEEYAAEAGIDIIGLNEIAEYKADDVISLLNATIGLMQGEGSPSEQAVSAFVAAYNEAFDTGTRNKFHYTSTDINGKAVVKINGKIDEEALLSTGYIRIGVNLFHKIAESEFGLSVDALYNKVINRIKGEADINFITEAIIPSVFTNGELDVNKLTDEKLQPTIKAEIRNYVLANLNKNILNKTLAEKAGILSLRFANPKVDLTPTIEDFSAFNTISAATKTNNTETIQKLWASVLSEKIKNSLLYQNALKYFININGTLIFDTENEVAKTIALEELRRSGMLNAVTKLAFETNNQSLLDMVGKPEVTFITDESKRAYYSAFPMALKEYSGMIRTQDGVAFSKSKDQFIRIGNRVFESVRNIGNSGGANLRIFTPIQMGTYSPAQSIDASTIQLEGQDLEYFIADAGQWINFNGNAKKAQNIVDEIDNCK